MNYAAPSEPRPCSPTPVPAHWRTVRHHVALLSFVALVGASCLGPNPLLDGLEDGGGMGPPDIQTFTVDGSTQTLPVVTEARTIEFVVEASDGDGIATVEFLDEEIVLGEGLEGPEGTWKLSWTVSGEEFDGNRKIRARVTDMVEEVTTAGPIDVPIDMPTGGALALDVFDVFPSSAGGVHDCALAPDGTELSLVGNTLDTEGNLEIHRIDAMGNPVTLPEGSVTSLEINNEGVDVHSGEAASISADGVLYVAATATTPTGEAVLGLRYEADTSLNWGAVNMANGATQNLPRGVVSDGTSVRIATLTEALGFRIDVFDANNGALLPTGFGGPAAAVDLAPGPESDQLWVAGTAGSQSRLELFGGIESVFEVTDPLARDGRIEDMAPVDDGGVVIAGIRERASVGTFEPDRTVYIGIPFVARISPTGTVLWSVDLETDNDGDAVGGVAVSPLGTVAVVRGVGCKEGAGGCPTQGEQPSEIRITSLDLEDGSERWTNASLGVSYGPVNMPACIEMDALGTPWIAFTGGSGADNHWYAARLNP